MNTTKEQQKELDDALVAPENRLKIGKSNLRLSSNLKSKEPTIQVVLDALKLTPFYNAFEISADVPEIYMQEFWVTVTRHHSSLRFKLDGKSHTVNVDNFRDMLKICPKLPGQKFEEPPLEEDILSFIRDLGHTGEIKFLSDVNVNHMHQPWRSFAAIINKCLSGKTTTLESLRLSRAQILWGMYHNKQVDYVYLLWEDLVFQVENKNSKKNNDMYYPRFTKVILDYFMAKDQAISRRNKMFWHYHLTNQAMLESEAFKTYRAYATGEMAPKSKATKKKTDSESSPKTKPTQASKGKRIKTSVKGDKPATTKSKGLTVLSEVALSEAEQTKLVTKRSLKEFHIFHASGSGDEVDILSNVSMRNNKPDLVQMKELVTDQRFPMYSNTDQRVKKNPRLSVREGMRKKMRSMTMIKKKKKEEEKADDDDDDDDVTSDQKVSTPPDYELTEEDENQQDDDTIGEEQGDEDNGELYGDLNINLSRSDDEMKDAQTNTETEEAHVTLTTEPLVVQLQISSASSDLVAKFINPSSDTEIPNFASLFGFERRVSSLESDMSELKQTNQFAKALSSIPGIVDKYLETKVKDTVDVVVQLKSDKLREEAQAENQDFLNSLDSNMKRIIKEQVKAQTSKIMTKVEKYVTETLGAEVLVRSTNQPQTSYTVASSLLELKLKNILMDKMEENNSIDKSDVQKNLYRALLKAYYSDKDLLSSYGEVVTLKRGRDDQDKDEEPSAGSNRGSKRQRSGKEESSKEATQKKSKSISSSKGTTRSPPKSSGKSIQEEVHDPRLDDLEEPFHQEFDTGNDDVSPIKEATDVDERLWNPSGSRTPDRE
ncbi:hypothetical protein Tco_1474219 [Tanacetum coccineum]